MGAGEIAANVKKKEKRKSEYIFWLKMTKALCLLINQKIQSLFFLQFLERWLGLIGVIIDFYKREHGIFSVDIGMPDGRVKSQRIPLNQRIVTCLSMKV